MNVPRKLAKLIPLPLARKRMLANIDTRAFRKNLEAAKASGDSNEVERVMWEKRLNDAHEFDSDEIEYSQRLVRQARELRVPLPPFPSSQDDDNEFWVRSDIFGTRYLTAQGVASVRSEIRKEELWIREQRSHLIAWCTALAGVVGTLTGLAAVLS